MNDDASSPPEILCIGSVLWDVIGWTEREMPYGADRPGRIQRSPGGVAMNIAMALRRFGLEPKLLSHIGEDAAGEELMRAAAEMKIDASLVARVPGLPTDQYLAVEGPEGLVAAIADAHALEAAGDAILAPLGDGRLGAPDAPFSGLVALDGNLTEALLTQISVSPLFNAADIRLAPASPGKAERLAPLLTHSRATLYVNLEEAGLLTGARHGDAQRAAEALSRAGATRVVVTDGPRATCALTPDGLDVALPPPTAVRRVTGAGDMFMAAHIAADLRGDDAAQALRAALDAAAAHVGGKTTP
ncbi:MAG: PfkB family carbohydrate kinase [Pseudomonadota bacterium]